MELEKRLKKFNEDLKKLLSEHSFDLSSEAHIVDGKIATKVVVVDNKKDAEEKEDTEEE